ncbi:hypothetical protein M3Y97_00313600 [Aphelenchoides bicaudatus]|nr:hypothetical protein M3Y97_00313600 [Aphelenchoides bicaudatus]
MKFKFVNQTIIFDPSFVSSGLVRKIVFVAIWTCFVFYFALLYRWAYRRLRMIWYINKIPGPLSIPLLGTTWQFEWKINRLTLIFSVLWLGPFPIVAAFSADAVKEVLESQEVIAKGTEYNILKFWLGNGLLISSGEKWRRRRKLLTPAFHFNILKKFQQVHDNEGKILVKQLEQFAGTNKPFDAYPFLKRCALDIICETSMGVKVNAQTDHNHPYVNAVRVLNKLSFAFVRMPWLWIKPLWYALGYGFDYDENLALVTDFTRQVIANRREMFLSSLNEQQQSENEQEEPNQKRKSYALLDLLLSVQQEGNEQMTDEDIREEVDTFMFEGHDTTASAMGWAVWCLSHHPECQQKVIDEVDRVFGDSDRDCTAEDLVELRYLEQCIKEALRIYPPVPFFSRKVRRDFMCSGYKIPRGATLLVSPNLVQVDKEHFPNPMEYNPDNFTPEASAKRHPFAFIPFSAGPRNCIGQKFALMEEKTVLSWFFRYYRVRATLPFTKNISCFEIINKPYKGVPVFIEYRKMPTHLKVRED